MGVIERLTSGPHTPEVRARVRAVELNLGRAKGGVRVGRNARREPSYHVFPFSFLDFIFCFLLSLIPLSPNLNSNLFGNLNPFYLCSLVKPSW